jgi:hypothetical protein
MAIVMAQFPDREYRHTPEPLANREGLQRTPLPLHLIKLWSGIAPQALRA